MNDVNNVTVTGRVGRSPESRDFDNGSVANFSMAIGETYKDKSGQRVENTTWMRVAAFGWMSGMVMDELSKGQKVTVSGSLQSRKWTDRDGNERETVEIKARSIHPGAMPRQRDDRGSQSQDRPQAQPQAQNQTKQSPYGGSERRDDLPF